MTVTPHGARGASPPVPGGDDGGELTGAGGPGMAERHKLGARPAGEMEDVDAAVHLAVSSPDSGARRMDPVFAVGVGDDDLAGKFDEFLIIRRQFPARYVHGRTLLVRPLVAA